MAILPAPEHFHLPENALLTVISKKKFYCSVFEVLDTWAELMNPEYYAIFAWSILESVGDTVTYPPQLRLPMEVPSCTNIDNEISMLLNFNEGKDRRHFLTVPNTIISRVPETLARLAARKKGTTINETQAQRIKAVYEKLKTEGKIYQAASDEDSDDAEAQNRRMIRDFECNGGSSSEYSSDENSDAAARRRAARKQLESRRIEALDIKVKSTFAANARQRTKFVKDDSLGMSEQRRARGSLEKYRSGSSIQQEHIDFQNFVPKKSYKDMATLLAHGKHQQALNSPVVSSFRGPSGEIVSHWQYGSTTLPVTDLLEDDSDIASFEKNFFKKGEGTNWREAGAEYKTPLSAKAKNVSDVSNSMIGRKLKLAQKVADAKQKKKDLLEISRGLSVAQAETANDDTGSVRSIEARVPTAKTENDAESKKNQEHVLVAAPSRYHSLRVKERQGSSVGTSNLELSSNYGIHDMRASRRREKERQIKALSEPELKISQPGPDLFVLTDSLASEPINRTMPRLRSPLSASNFQIVEDTLHRSRHANVKKDDLRNAKMKVSNSLSIDDTVERIKIRAKKVRQKL